MPSNSLAKQTVKLLRWHRRVGLLLATFILLLGSTGILINHTSDLALSDIRLTNNWLLSWYGLTDKSPRAAPTKQGFRLIDQAWISESNQQLYLNQTPVSDCLPPLLSAARHPDFYLALCNTKLILLTLDGEVIEVLSHGLPQDMDAVSVTHLGDIQLRAAGQSVVLDLDTLATTPTNHHVNWPERQPLPAALQKPLSTASQATISLETLLLDIHSGRILGRFGVYLMDVIALLTCLLAISGLWAWRNHKRILRQRE